MEFPSGFPRVYRSFPNYFFSSGFVYSGNYYGLNGCFIFYPCENLGGDLDPSIL